MTGPQGDVLRAFCLLAIPLGLAFLVVWGSALMARRASARAQRGQGPAPDCFYTASGGEGGGPIVRAPNPDFTAWLHAQRPKTRAQREVLEKRKRNWQRVLKGF